MLLDMLAPSWPHLFLPNGELPITLTVQDLMIFRDKAPPRPGKTKQIAARPTSIQQWQYETEEPPLAHWEAPAQAAAAAAAAAEAE